MTVMTLRARRSGRLDRPGITSRSACGCVVVQVLDGTREGMHWEPLAVCAAHGAKVLARPSGVSTGGLR